MADFPDSAKRQLGFFHGLSKVPTESSQYVYESKYKSSHTITNRDVWTDTVAYAANETEADAEAASNLAVQKYILQNLTPIPGSNEQAWFLDDNGTFVRPFISPVDIPHPTTNEPSYGYEVKLYDSNNNLITPTEGAWVVDYYAGIIKFAENYTPSDLNWGNPKITCYVYVGSTLETSQLHSDVEIITLDNTIINNKYLTLSQTPKDPTDVLVFVEGGPKGEYNVDYTVSSNTISWSGLAWESLLEVNDKLSIVYTY